MQAIRITTTILRRSSLLVFLYEPYHAAIVINHVLRQQGGLLACNQQLRLVRIKQENVEIIEQQIIMQIFSQLIQVIDVVATYQIV